MDRRDAELLREYATNGSPTAFTELVRRYVNLVYSAARRQVGDAHLAEEVARGVFHLPTKNKFSFHFLAGTAAFLIVCASSFAEKNLQVDEQRAACLTEAAERGDTATVKALIAEGMDHCS